jgi:hypothetical protein
MQAQGSVSQVYRRDRLSRSYRRRNGAMSYRFARQGDAKLVGPRRIGTVLIGYVG